MFLMWSPKQPWHRLGSPIRTGQDVQRALAGQRRARWVVQRSRALLKLLKDVQAKDTWHRLLVLDEPTMARRETLSAVFRVVVSPGGGVRLLSTEDLAEVFSAEHPEDYFIGGVVNHEDRMLVLYRGNLERLLVPLSWFGGARSKPDFSDFEVTDCGQTVRFGTYEAGADAILYELDKEARRRMNARQLELDDSLGAAIKRLRLQKRLSRKDFEPISAKTMARIERGEVTKPQRYTLDTIGERLGVAADELGSF